MSKEKALLLVDPQNDFLSDWGTMYKAVENVVSPKILIEKFNFLTTEMRNSGGSVFMTPITFSDGYKEAGEKLYGVFADVAEAGGFIRGTKGAEIADAISIEPEDTILEKNSICAFENPKLEESLKQKGVKRLFIAGLLTNVCVASTARIAYDKGFEVYTITDAVGTIDPSMQKSTIELEFPLFSKPITSKEYKSLLAQNIRR